MGILLWNQLQVLEKLPFAVLLSYELGNSEKEERTQKGTFITLRSDCHGTVFCSGGSNNSWQKLFSNQELSPTRAFCMLMNNVLMTSMLLSAFKMAFSFFPVVVLACLLCAAHDETSSKLKHFKKLKTRYFNLWMSSRGIEILRRNFRVFIHKVSLNIKTTCKTCQLLKFTTCCQPLEKLTVMGTSNFSSHVLSFRRNLKIVCVVFSLLDNST